MTESLMIAYLIIIIGFIATIFYAKSQNKSEDIQENKVLQNKIKGGKIII